MTEQTKTWSKETIQELIRTSDRAVVRAIKALYARQTATEQACHATREHNARGFNSNDAPFLTDIAKKLPRYNDHMTPAQVAKARNMLVKYWRQLLEIAEEGGAVIAKSPKREVATPALEPSHAQTAWGRF